jgi:nucleoside-diphosphate-sugar epimerase
MKVFLAGGSGAIALRLVPQLVARGHEVVATTTDAEKVGLVRSLDAEPVVVDGLDTEAVIAAVVCAQPEAIVHEMTALGGEPSLKHFDRWFALTNQLRTRGTANLLAAAQAAGVRRFVAQSYTGWTNSRTGGAKDEEDPLDVHPAKAQRKSLAAIRYLEDAVASAPLEGIALRYGSLYGPGSSESVLELVRKRQWPIVGDGHGVWSWIHNDDASAATVAALERGKPGIYNVVDDEPAEVAEWLPYLAEVTGSKPPRRIPKWLGRLALGEAGVQWLTEGRGASNAKAKHELGWRPFYPSWRDGFAHGLSRPPLGATDLEQLIGPAVSTAPSAGTSHSVGVSR